MAGFMVSTHLQPPFASYEISEGVKDFGCKTLDGNWFEERTRAEHGEEMADSMFPEGTLMAGAKTCDFDPDLSIARSNEGKLTCPERLARSRITNNSSRQGADDGFREYVSMNSTFMPGVKERPAQPVSSDASYHSTWGGPIQHDGRSKTRFSAETRSKNVQREQGLHADGDASQTKKMIAAATRLHTAVPRPSANSHRTGEFGSVVPQRAPSYDDADRLQTTSQLASSWMGDQAVTYRTLPMRTLS